MTQTEKHRTAPIIIWFRQDLRLKDNPALIAAHESARPILPLYILDDENSGEWKMGGASRWWLHASLTALNENLCGKLSFARGDSRSVLLEQVRNSGAEAVYWNRCYEPWRIAGDAVIEADLGSMGIEVKSFNASLLFEPPETVKKDGTPYKVFTPFFQKGCLDKGPVTAFPEAAPKNPALIEKKVLLVEDLQLLPENPWHKKLVQRWQPGETGAQECLEEFLDNGLRNYKEGRDYPSRDNVSRLSPHLHFGEISPQQVWQDIKARMIVDRCERDGEHFLRELGWREFSYSLLYHFHDLPRTNLQKKFDNFPWRDDNEALECWQKGQTGYPIVDAGMRELWKTGYMHNRVRMIVGSFLVKNLLLHWHHGEDWFWDTLVDADLANNSASWQWIAGCGADAAPFFRIFNPVTQGQKFDSEGVYVRKYVPEISKLPNKYLHSPWQAPGEVLVHAGITLGEDYPAPIVDLQLSRKRALAAFKEL